LWGGGVVVACVFLVALIVLIDLSGFGASDEIIQLLYVGDELEVVKDELGGSSDMSAEELASRVEEKIFNS
jgi:hypothetical protein